MKIEARKWIPLAVFLGMIALGLACSPTVVTPDPALVQAQIELAVQATNLALQIEAQQQAAQAPATVPTIAPPPTAESAAPPTDPPPTAAPPTAAPPTAVEDGVLVRASFDPAAGFGPPDVTEDFEGTRGLFSTTAGGTVNSWYGGGKYHLTYASRYYWWWNIGDISLKKNFYMDIVITHGEQCVERDIAGMLVRYLPKDDYGTLIGINCLGQFFIGDTFGSGSGGEICSFKGHDFVKYPKDVDCSGQKILRFSEHLVTGPGAVNRLGVRGTGTTYEIFLNGRSAGTFTNTWITTRVSNPFAGAPAIMFGAGQKNISGAEYDDFSLWQNP